MLTLCPPRNNDTLLLFGGWSHPSMYPLHRWRLFNEHHSYDIVEARWTKIIPVTEVKPPTMAGHSATIHRNQMIVYGGLQKQRTIGQFSSSSDVWAFNLESRFSLGKVFIGISRAIKQAHIVQMER